MEEKHTLITVCIPSYNSAPFLHYAVDSLIEFGEDIEVIIIDDGSKDETGAIADEYEKKYPFIKAVHQPNGGHGEGINHGLALAQGLYYRVLDSDDWVEATGFRALLDDIKTTGAKADLYITDYTYWQGRENRDVRITYNYLFKERDPNIAKGGAWSEMKKFRYDRNLTLHSTMYRTSTLRECGVHCPAHVSYEDNYFVYAPLSFVKQVRYVPQSVYQYLIGREGQSMTNTTCLRKHRDFVTDGKLIFDAVDLYSIKDKGTRRAVYHHFIMNMVLSVLHSKLRNDKEGKEAIKEFWAHCKASNKRQYRLARRHFAIAGLSIPGPLGYVPAKLGYALGHKIVKFN